MVQQSIGLFKAAGYLLGGVGMAGVAGYHAAHGAKALAAGWDRTIGFDQYVEFRNRGISSEDACRFVNEDCDMDYEPAWLENLFQEKKAEAKKSKKS